MRHAQHSRASSRRTVRRGVRRWLAIATGALSLALVLEFVLEASATAAVRAQVTVTAKPSVTVFGVGEATVPADTATVQILISHGGRQFGFSQGASGGEVFESGSAIAVPGGPPEPERVPPATPETSATGTEGAVSTRGRRGGRNRRSGPEPITAERLAPIVAAVATSTGIAPDAVAINFSPLATEPFGRRPESARLDFDVAAPTPEALNSALIAASDAAAANGLVVEVAGVLYRPGDCAVVEEEAAMAAIEDARDQADRLAPLLDVTLGGVVGASSDPYLASLPEGEGCSGQQSIFYDSAHGGLGLTVPIFDPSLPAEVEVSAVIHVSFEILDSDPTRAQSGPAHTV
jgi:hypothetical protein